MARERRSTAPVLGALLLLATLVGCGGGSSATGPGTPAPSGDGSSTAPTSPASGPATSPTVAAATGALLRTQHVQARIPSDWHLSAHQASFQKTGFDAGGQEIDVGEFPTIGTSSLRALMRTANKIDFGGKGTILPSVTVNGVRFGHVRGREYDLVVDDYQTYVVTDLSRIAGVTFSLHRDKPAAQRQAVIDQVLATLTIRS